MRNALTWTVLVIFLLGAGLISGCARFNTFYNAEQSYKDAEKARAKSKTGQPSAAEIQLYDKAIQKASKVLTFHPNSGLVDDALLLMGKAYYGKSEYLKAARKFTELIENFPQSELVYEASFWRGTCYYAVGNHHKAEQSLAAIVNQKGAKKWAAEAQFLLAEMAFEEERFRYAMEEYAKVVSRFSNCQRCAEAQYRIGQCLTILDKPSEALRAYERVFGLSPHDTVKLNASFSIGQSLREEGRYDQAIGAFKALLKDSRNFDYYSAIRLEIAECEAEGGDLERAIADYEDIIKDYPKSESSSEAYYHLGLIYLNTVGDLARAREHFEAVKTESSKSKYTGEAQETAKNIEALTKLYDQLMPPRPDSTASESQTQTVAQGGQGELPELTLDQVLAEMLSGIAATGKKEEGPALSPGSADTVQATLAQQTKAPQAATTDTAEVHFKLAELYLFQFSKADSALKHYQKVIEEFPDSDYGAKSAFAIAWVTDIILNDLHTAQDAYLSVIRDFPGTTYDEAARQILGDTLTEDETSSEPLRRFAEAEEEFLQGGDIDSLIHGFQGVVDHYPDSPYAPKAEYAIAWMEEHIRSDRRQAREVYQAILDTYGDTDYAREAKLKLGLEQPQKAAPKTVPQQKKQETVKEAETGREPTLEDIIQEMLLEGPVAVAEPEFAHPDSP